MIDIVIMAALQDRRRSIEEMVRGEASMNVVGLAPTFAFLRSLIREITASVAIIELPAAADSASRLEWLVELSGIVSPVLLATTIEPRVFRNIVSGERGALLHRDASSAQLIQAVRATSLGLLTLDSRLVPHAQSEEADEPLESLTAREIDVLQLLAEGLPNREIAQRLNISEHTIKFHIRSILGKLGAATRTEAVTRGVRSGLIEL
jgi:two-component system, NarL family, response regulator YdfI